MSQYFLQVAGGTPSIPTQFTADDATFATPAGNNLNITSVDVTANNLNGVRTTAGTDTFVIQLTNRQTGSAAVTGVTTGDIITFACGSVAGTYFFKIECAAFESTGPSGAGYEITGTVRTDGAAATVIGTPDKIINEDAALSDSDMNLVVSSNNAIVRATGVMSLTITYTALLTYVFQATP